MDLVELTCTVNKSGTLKIPNVILHEMGLLAGDSVRLAFLSNGTGQNIFQEFMITPNGVDGVAQTDIISEIAIPNELLSVANIASGSQLQIECVNGAISTSLLYVCLRIWRSFCANWALPLMQFRSCHNSNNFEYAEVNFDGGCVWRANIVKFREQAREGLRDGSV